MSKHDRKDETPMKIYIAGPVTGRKNNNAVAFEQAAQALLNVGHIPVNPLDYTRAQWPWAKCMRIAITQMMTCDGVALLDGYQDSLGAMIEYELAERIEMEVKPLAAWLDAEGVA